ncbi:MAG: pilus assembly protein CpaE [Sphingomonadales bacterium]|nr:pilus assembly protein CpaE [Sphingomonadales bacterium]PIX67678.1 MAG: pilus assembly protein CpaE [Sphingomonadales bacterium CG_4_10_14_3_um_filter_58_15]NCO47766.1 pilus assembly protein CpaE [Sphingomonadales bacterium]NCO99689.1 pilus assembly protein CpaE [Sphingomonadales bacterium]NCP27529.1 pilus assembly protein CpaE [Sphingomonadales bacterium]
MNAPWKPGSAGGREPFAAFVCDDDTLEILRPVAEEMGWSVDKCNKGGLRNAVQTLSVSASPNILLVDLSESGDPLNDINSLAEVCEPGTVVVAMGQVNDVRLYRDLIVSGLQDYLLKPFSPEQLRDVLAQAQAVLNAPKNEDPQAEKPHISTAVIGTRGGVGASTIATSVAWLLSNDKERLTALLDLDVHFGTGALSLDLEPGRGLIDAIDNPSRIDGLFIERAMIKANEKLSLLSAEAPIHSPIMTDGTAFFQLQEEFRAAFDCTVIDLPRDMLINYPHLLGDVNATIIVTELTLASARDCIRLLSWLKSHAAQSKVYVVANKVQTSNLEISRQDFEGSIERKIDVLVPYDPRTAAQSAKLGQALVEAGKSSKASAKIIELTNLVLGSAGVGDDADAMGDKKSLLEKFGDLKSLLPSKKIKEDAPKV